MEHLWAPWRMQYIEGDNSGTGCILCLKYESRNDENNYVLFRTKHSISLLNLYPYNNGHTMIAPRTHTSRLEDLEREQREDLFDLLLKTKAAIDKAYKPAGYNIGMNIGACAGAGITDHLHIHIVPRWSGDTNFMPVLADTKVMPQALAQTCAKIKNMF